MRYTYKSDISSSNITDGGFSRQNALKADSQDTNASSQIDDGEESLSSEHSCSLLSKLRSELPTILKHLPDTGNDWNEKYVGLVSNNKDELESNQDHFPSIETDSLERGSVVNVLSPEDIFERHVESLSDDVFETESDTRRRLGIDTTIPDQHSDIKNSLHSDDSAQQLTSVSQTDLTTPESLEYSSSSGSFVADFESLIVIKFEHEVDRREEFIIADACDKFEHKTGYLDKRDGEMPSFLKNRGPLVNDIEETNKYIATEQPSCEEMSDISVLVQYGIKGDTPAALGDNSHVADIKSQSSTSLQDNNETKQCNSTNLFVNTNDSCMIKQPTDLHFNQNCSLGGKNDTSLPTGENIVPSLEVLHRNHGTIEHAGFCEYLKCDLAVTSGCVNVPSDKDYIRLRELAHIQFTEVELYINEIIQYALKQVLEADGDGTPLSSVEILENSLESCNYQEFDVFDDSTNNITLDYCTTQEYSPENYPGTLAPIPEVDPVLENYVSDSVYNDISETRYHSRYRIEGLQPIPEVEIKIDNDTCSSKIIAKEGLNEYEESIVDMEDSAFNTSKDSAGLKIEEIDQQQENTLNTKYSFDINARDSIQSNSFKPIDSRINDDSKNKRLCIIHVGDKYTDTSVLIEHKKDGSLEKQFVASSADVEMMSNTVKSKRLDYDLDNSLITQIIKDSSRQDVCQTNSNIVDTKQIPGENSNVKLNEGEIEKRYTKENKEDQFSDKCNANSTGANNGNVQDEKIDNVTKANRLLKSDDDQRKEDLIKQAEETDCTMSLLSEHVSKKAEEAAILMKEDVKEEEDNCNSNDLVIGSNEEPLAVFKKENQCLETSLEGRQNIGVISCNSIHNSDLDESYQMTQNSSHQKKGSNVRENVEASISNETVLHTNEKINSDILCGGTDARKAFLSGNSSEYINPITECTIKEIDNVALETSNENCTPETSTAKLAVEPRVETTDPISTGFPNDMQMQSKDKNIIQTATQVQFIRESDLPLQKDGVDVPKAKSESLKLKDSSPGTDASSKAKMLSKILKSNLSTELGRRPEYRTHSRYQSNSLNLEDQQKLQTGALRNHTPNLRKVKSLDLEYSYPKQVSNNTNSNDWYARKYIGNQDLQHNQVFRRCNSDVDPSPSRNSYTYNKEETVQQTVTGNPVDYIFTDRKDGGNLFKSKTLDIKKRPKSFEVVFNDSPKTDVRESFKDYSLYREDLPEKVHFKNLTTEDKSKSDLNNFKQDTYDKDKELDLKENGMVCRKNTNAVIKDHRQAGNPMEICSTKSRFTESKQLIEEKESDLLTRRRNAFKEGTFKVKRVTSDDLLNYEKPAKIISSVETPSTEIKDYIDAINIENKFYVDSFTVCPVTSNAIEKSVNQIYKDTKNNLDSDRPGHRDNRIEKKETFSSLKDSRCKRSENKANKSSIKITDDHVCKYKKAKNENSNCSRTTQRHQSFEKSDVYDNIGTASNRVKTDQFSQDRTTERQDRSLINSPHTQGFNQNNGRAGYSVTKTGNTETVKKSSERPKCRSRDYVATPLKRNKGRVNEMRIQEHLEKKQKDGPLSLTDAYGSMETNDTHTGHALTNSANHLSESMTSLSNRHAPMTSPSRQGTLNKQQSLQSSHSELNGDHRHEEGIKFERLKNLPEEELMVKIKEIIGHMERLEDYHRGDGMRIQKMLGDMYWDYTHMREMIGDCMADNGYAVVSMTMLKTLNSIGIFKNDDVWFPTYYTYNTMWNFTDASSKLAKALSENDAVRLLTLNCGHKPYINAIHSKNVYYVIKASLSILHNIARNSGMKHLFDENKTSETIMPFLESEDEMLKILATLTIANIVDEEENKTIIAESGTIHDIVNWIEKALSLPRRRYKGFTPQELTEGLNKLAVNDANKMRIVDEGALQMFLQMLQHDDIREQSSAARIVWTLSFDKDVRQKINENTELVSVMEKLTDSTNKSLQTNCSGALWIIRGDNEVNNEKRPKTNKNKSHVFLSYAWSDKDIVLNIRDRLRAEGYAIWIDIEKMGKATLETMTEAIENSAVVLVCMSEKYKQSPNCRTEAEYTFQLKKDYIPLMMQKKYRPDGWVGTILGAKLYFDFSGKYPFDKSFQGLLKELRGRGKVTPNTTPGDSNDHTDPAMVHSMSLSSHTSAGTPVHHMPLNSAILNMGQEELIKWLRNVKLTECIPAFMEFDGRLLMQLKIMRTEAPEFFYQCLEKRLNMSLIEILKFTRALEELQ